MNKRCTSSSCRRVFSTLDFEGFCPWCGKAYPQLVNTGKNGERRAFIMLRVKDGGKTEYPRIRIAELRREFQNGKFLRGAVEFRRMLPARGYKTDPKSVLAFCGDLMAGRKPGVVRHTSGERENGLPVLTLSRPAGRKSKQPEQKKA